MKMQRQRQLRVGFLLNPIAGVGGPAAFKGSDAESTLRETYAGKLPMRASARAIEFFNVLKGCQQNIQLYCVRGPMGSEVVEAAGLSCELIDCEVQVRTTAEDTKRVALGLQTLGVDIIVFAGGDGTARDICEVVDSAQLCLGIPAGVKMQSGVFGIHPCASAALISDLSLGKLAGVAEQEVRDIDEEKLREGIVSSQLFGYLKVPENESLVQHVKQAGEHKNELVLADIADEVRERIEELQADNCLLIFGPGSTTHFIQNELNFGATLLGVDVIFCNGDEYLDVDEQSLGHLIEKHSGEVRLLLTAIGGQGHILGRGNQQISPDVLKRLGRDKVWLVASPEKIQGLQGRPLIIDSGDRELDRTWFGLVEVISGYRKTNLYMLGDTEC